MNRSNIVPQNGGKSGDARSPFKGALARHHLVEHVAERENVRSRIHMLAFGLLRRHIAHSADDGTFARQRGLHRALLAALPGQARVHPFGETEIQHFDQAGGGDHDVGGLQVSMDDARGMRGRQCAGDLRSVLQGLRGGQPAGGNQIAQGFAGDVFHHDALQVAFRHDVVQRNDVGMVQGRSGLSFLKEPPPPLRVGGEAG
jgi:hypothetical protein